MTTLDLDRQSYYNDMGIDTLWTGDVAASLDISIDVRPPVDIEDIDARRRGFERYDLSANQIRTTVHNGPNRSMSFGRLLNASVTGMWVQTTTALPFRSSVIVEWCVMGFSHTFVGRVVRQSSDGMAIHLETDDSSWRFRSSFIDLARTPSDDPPSVVVRLATDQEATSPSVEDAAVNKALATNWTYVLADIEDDKRNQDFINAALKARRLQFALECYRQVKSDNPESEVATKYLKQIGTILSFYTLQPANVLAVTPEKRKLLPFVVFALVVIGLLLLAPMIAQRKLDRPVTKPPTAEPTQLHFDSSGPGAHR